MGKTALAAPLYISVSWSLIISYQLFTQNAVYSIIHFLNSFWPQTAEFLVSRIDTIAFIHAFAWIFVLSSVIPSIILGKGRSVLLQFFLCLTVAFVAVSVEDMLTLMIGTEPTTQMQVLSIWFHNPLVAGLYLSAPYLSMLYLDIQSRRKSEKEEEPQETKAAIEEEIAAAEQKESYSVTSDETNNADKVTSFFRDRSKRKVSFLYGIAAICFALALVTFWFDKVILSTILTQSYKLLYVTIFTCLGVILAVLGHYTTGVLK
ncbi:MAG: hypothetical protein OEY24_06185 [Candidatus Bathyarchaeota archaeon]|nr:hypothetical protein [Candidatus Bathyarchaeota archaeon]MDH5495276.1 hypothetical protein [Candidatus Bathyarchaeota archaeon]